jgi:hypothetical protein
MPIRPRLATALLAVFVLGLLPVGAGVTPLAAAHGGGAAVHGAGTDASAAYRVTFTFQANYGNPHATGRAGFDTPSGHLTGTVDCLYVNAHRAAIAGTIDTPVPQWDYFLIIVADHGHAKPHRRPHDQILIWGGDHPWDCEVGDLIAKYGANVERIHKGEIVVAP